MSEAKILFESVIGKSANIKYTRCDCRKCDSFFLYYQTDMKRHIKMVSNPFTQSRKYDFGFENKWKRTFEHDEFLLFIFNKEFIIGIVSNAVFIFSVCLRIYYIVLYSMYLECAYT